MLERTPMVFNRLANTLQERIKIETVVRSQDSLQWWLRTFFVVPRRLETVNSLQFTSTVARSCTRLQQRRQTDLSPTM